MHKPFIRTPRGRLTVNYSILNELIDNLFDSAENDYEAELIENHIINSVQMKNEKLQETLPEAGDYS